jgi:hypothetical protein
MPDDAVPTRPVTGETLSALPRPGQTLAAGARIDLDGEHVRNGVAQLVLTLVKLLHELLER